MVKIVIGANSFETDDSSDASTQEWFRIWVAAIGVGTQQADIDALAARLKSSSDSLQHATEENHA